MTEKQTPWVSVTASKIDPPDVESEVVDGIEVNVFLSPYDLPRALRGYYSEILKRFVIEFRYVDEEDFVLHNEKEPIVLRVGKRSRRMLGFQIDTDRLDVQQVELNLLTEAIDHLIEEDAEQERHDNYLAAKEALEEVADRVLVGS